MFRLSAAVLATLLLLAAQPIAPAVVATHGNAAEAFEQTWERTDLPVASNEAVRTWIWGPQPLTEIIHESYAEADDGQRSVQYYDKSRMEVTYPDADQASIWYVTNGLLVMELMTGRLQLGDNTFETRPPAEVNVAGDASDPSSPTYRTMASVMGEAATDVGGVINQRISRSGVVTIDEALTTQGVTSAIVVNETGHSIAKPFWDFMNSSGVVYSSGSFVQDVLFQSPYFATGLPVTEPYWTDARVDGETMLVLIQCFERRCLTYTPNNAPEWQVEAGNVGLHYWIWRYETDDQPQPPPNCEPGEGADFAGDNLLQPAFIGQDLACADFSGATITQGNFTEADLSYADFSGADLQQPVFENATISNAVFSQAQVVQAVFEGTEAINADFSGATLAQPIFSGANLLGAELQNAQLITPQFENTICPDSTNSDDNGGTCLANLEPIPPPVP